MRQELAPDEDQGVVFSSFNGPSDANIDYLKQTAPQVEKVFQEPEIDTTFVLAGAGNVQSAAGFSTDYAGGSRQYIQEGNALVVTFAFALIVIYLVLSAQYESFRDPLVSVPLSVVGALIPLAIGLSTFNIYSQIGLVTLIGLITKHGILMCEVARERQELDGLDRRAPSRLPLCFGCARS